MRKSLIIRIPTARQLPKIYNLLFAIPYMELPEYEVWRAAVKKGRYPNIRAAIKDDKPVGTAIYDIVPSYTGNLYVFLYCLAVDEEYRKQGVGRSLLDVVKEHGKNEGADCVCFICHRKNRKAQKFYAKMKAVSDQDWLEMSLPIIQGVSL